MSCIIYYTKWIVFYTIPGGLYIAYKVGCKIYHTKWGVGTILQIGWY